MKRLAVLVAALAVVASACAATDAPRIVVGAGTTVVDSGLLALLVEAYKEDGGRGEVDVIALSSQQSFAYASAGNADVTITHEPDLLAGFLTDNPEAVSSPVFASRFVFVADDSLEFMDRTVDGILGSVASSAMTFVSRDDGSGTFAKEQELWQSTGIDPTGEDWYIRTGTGMGETLLVTDQRRGVTLSELGAYLTARDQLSLRQVEIAPDPRLGNPYDITVVSPNDHDASVEFFAWLTSEPGRAAIVAANDALFGAEVYELP